MSLFSLTQAIHQKVCQDTGDISNVTKNVHMLFQDFYYLYLIIHATYGVHIFIEWLAVTKILILRKD